MCSTSVVSHWEQKIAQHPPGLTVTVYHSGEGDLAQSVSNADVLITSCGILRRDQEVQSPVMFGVAVFDEIHQIKIAGTLS